MLTAVKLACVRGERPVFADVELELGTGSALVVTGPNGSGKTSLLRIVCGLLAPAAGEIRWDGTGTKALGEEFLGRVAYVGHLNGLKDELNAVENLRLWSGICGVEISAGAARDALGRLGLDGREELPVRWLSQGQKRRAALARLLVAKRPLWVLDEPFTALDRNAVVQVETLLAQHLASGGMALLSTHQELQGSIGAVRRLTLGQ